MRNLRLDICYDGTRYRGWQRLPGRDDTIQGKLETALSRILEEPIEVSGSGRTDAGVHALHQAANFHCESAMPAGEILSKLRQYLRHIFLCGRAAPVPCPPERPRQDLPLPYLEFPGAVRFSAAVRCGHAGTP